MERESRRYRKVSEIYDQGTEMLTTASTKNPAWSARTFPSRAAIRSQERRSIHIPTAKMVKNAASCRNAENDKAICGSRTPLRSGS